jgi:hypothetical protein
MTATGSGTATFNVDATTNFDDEVELLLLVDAI